MPAPRAEREALADAADSLRTIRTGIEAIHSRGVTGHLGNLHAVARLAEDAARDALAAPAEEGERVPEGWRVVCACAVCETDDDTCLLPRLIPITREGDQ